MLSYVIGIIVMLLLFILVSHSMNNKRINNTMKIQQVEHPDIEMINLLQNNKLPTLYLYELELWEGFDLMIGEEYENIKDVINNKDALTKLKFYLRPYNLPMRSNWNITLHKNIEKWESLSNIPIKQNNINNFFVNISGLMMVCLFNPSKENMSILSDTNNNKNNNTNNDTQINNNIKELMSNEETVQKIEYIVIPIRPSHMIYIPYGWWYWIYNGSVDKYCCYLDCNNV